MAEKNPKTENSSETASYSKGLENVTVCQSKLCRIDGKEGKLYYAGYAIEDLAQSSTFEEVCFLLWQLRLPRTDELERLEKTFRDSRALPPEVVNFMKLIPSTSHPMDALRTVVSLLASLDLNPEKSPEANLHRAVSLTAKLPTIIATFHRLRQNTRPVQPHASLGHAANFLYMLHGKEPDKMEARIMDMALVLHADHEMNASTFSSLVTASTLSDLYSAIVSGIGTLKGPLHGGANEVVLQMLLDIGDPAKVEAYVDDTKVNKKRIMGFGHRVYKAYDPRAKILKEYARRLSEKTRFSRFFKLNEKLEEVMKARYGEKGIFPNVDLYSGIVYHQLGIATDLFTPIFALSRVSGWTAHVLEYWQDNRLFRPNADYVGAAPRPYVPIGQR